MKKFEFVDDENQFQWEEEYGRSFYDDCYLRKEYDYNHNRMQFRKELHLVEQFGYYYYARLKK